MRYVILAAPLLIVARGSSLPAADGHCLDAASLLQTPAAPVKKHALQVSQSEPSLGGEDAQPRTVGQVLLVEDVTGKASTEAEALAEVKTQKANFKSAAVFLLAMIFGSLMVAMTWLGIKHAWKTTFGSKESAESDSDSDLVSSSAGASPPASPRANFECASPRQKPNEEDGPHLETVKAVLHNVYANSPR